MTDPAPEPRAATTTILFTDLVSSTELMQRAGDEDAQRIFKSHYQLLRDAVSTHGGAEVKSLGDGLMVAFHSAADAVRCAIAMQQASRRRSGERLAIRVGLNAGDALRDEGDYFGTPVVIARRLCDRAEAGQIICSALVRGLLAGRQAFVFADLGELALKGIVEPIAACEVVFERDEPSVALAVTPFVGRTSEVTKLRQKLEDARAGHGALVMLVGEPGIGKTRTSQEFAQHARNAGALVLWGRCFEGEWAPPFGPFAEAIGEYARAADADQLREDLGYGAAPIARLVPSLRERLPDLPEPVADPPDEERFRLLDAVSQFLIALSRRSPVVVVLDDLHWADRGTIAMLRHVARFARDHRILLLGNYRDVELDRQHPLADALAALRREVEYERIALKGLDSSEVGTLLATLAEQDVNPALVTAISDETDGNPFFIREVLIHLIEDGKLYREGGEWKSTAQSIADLGIPEGVRQVITRRLSRLSATANRLLTAASAFNGGFRFQTVAGVAGLDEDATLDAIDEALEAQVLRPGSDAEHYDFTHALIRHTLYGELNPSRQVRLHRQIAEVMGARVATYAPARQAAHAAELAYQYHRSAAIPGAERGVDFAVAAADHAEESAAWDEVVTFLRIATDLLPEADARGPRLAGRLAIALARTLAFEEAMRSALAAGELILAGEGERRAGEYLSTAARALWSAGSQASAFTVARRGLELIGEPRDASWARLKAYDLVRIAAEDPDDPGIALDSPERDEVNAVLRTLPLTETERNELVLLGLINVTSREEVLRDHPTSPALLTFWAGEYRQALPLWEDLAREEERRGLVAWAAASNAQLSRVHTALGNFPEAEAALAHAQTLATRLTGQSTQTIQIFAAASVLAGNRGFRPSDEPPDQSLVAQLLASDDVEIRWVAATLRAAGALTHAGSGRTDEALGLLRSVIEPIERAPGWATNYSLLISLAANVVYALDRPEFVDVIERNLREKVLRPDFRYPGTDARQAMAWLCVVARRWDEALEWQAKARTVLDEAGARPTLAIVDLDEADLYHRRGAAGDRERALRVLEAAIPRFEVLAMPGWAAGAAALQTELA